MLIMGIDPGLLNIGWGFAETVPGNNNIKFIGCGSQNIRDNLSMPDKLHTIHNIICEKIRLYSPAQVAVERTLVNINPRASLSLCHARGAIMLTLALQGMKVFEYCPTEIKKALTGKGNADKMHVMKMLKLMFPDTQAMTSHSADALAIAVTHGFHSMLKERA